MTDDQTNLPKPVSAQPLRWFVAAALACGAWAPVLGQPQPAASAASAANAAAGALQSLDQASLQSWIEHNEAAFVPSAARQNRIEVTVGSLDSRLRLAPCARIEPYMPPGMRLWGRARIGVRCLEGQSRWDVSIPVTVKVWGMGWVVNAAVAEGSPLQADMLTPTEVDLAAENIPALVDEAQWQGLVAARPLGPGQVLKASSVRPAQLFAAGAQVRVVVEGKGFQVSVEGQALAPGLQGKPVRIRLDNGRVVTGTPLDERSVQAAL
jgi:flagella basal body P-ring formation protein FlgA